jgi:hypothetical protein
MKPANVSELLFTGSRPLSEAEIKRIATHVAQIQHQKMPTLLTAMLTVLVSLVAWSLLAVAAWELWRVM